MMTALRIVAVAVFWFMVAVAVGTFAIFLPHTALWGFRELIRKKNGEGGSHGTNPA